MIRQGKIVMPPHCKGPLKVSERYPGMARIESESDKVVLYLSDEEMDWLCNWWKTRNEMMERNR